MTVNSDNVLSVNPSNLEYLQDDDDVTGYDYNRIIDALTGNRDGIVTIALQGVNMITPTQTSLVHNDTWVNTENVDPNFPGRLSYVVPANVTKVIEARLSFKLLTYRTYNTFSVAATGTESANHTHAVSGEAAVHTHSYSMANNNAGTPIGIDGSNNLVVVSGVGFLGRINMTDSGGDTGHNHGNTGNESGSHTHTIGGSSFLGITESTIATGVTIQFDTIDQTVALGGPWNADQVEINVLPYIPTTKNVWHTINLTSTQLGQIQSHLRMTFLVTATP